MLSDRSYMRGDYPRNPTSALTWLISAIVAAFVLQFVFLRWFGLDRTLDQTFALAVENIKAGKIWTLFTYGFLQSTSSILDVVLNLLALYFLGRVLEPMLGSRRFVGVYAAALVAGGGLWLATHWQTGGMAIGAWSGILGLLVVYAAFHPNQPMTFLLFFVLPVTLKPKHVVFGLLALELFGFSVCEVMGGSFPFWPVLPHSAHLGGMLAGWVYYRYVHATDWHLTASRREVELPPWFKKPPPAQPAAFQVDLTRRDDLRAEVDRILDKINSDGFGALTAAEKRLLDDAKDLLSRR